MIVIILMVSGDLMIKSLFSSEPHAIAFDAEFQISENERFVREPVKNMKNTKR